METSASFIVPSDSGDDDDDDDTKADLERNGVATVDLHPTVKEGIPTDLTTLKQGSLDIYVNQSAECANSTKEGKEKPELETVVKDCPAVGFKGTVSDFRSRKHHIRMENIERSEIRNVLSLKPDKEDVFEFPSGESFSSFKEQFSFKKFDKNVLQKRQASGSFKNTSNVVSQPWSSHVFSQPSARHGLFQYWSSPARNTHEGFVDIVNKELSPDKHVMEAPGQSVIGATNLTADLETFSSCDKRQTREQIQGDQFCSSEQDLQNYNNAKYCEENNSKITSTNKKSFDVKTSAINVTANSSCLIKNDKEVSDAVADKGKTVQVTDTNLTTFTDQTSARDVSPTQNYALNKTVKGRSGYDEYEKKNYNSKTLKCVNAVPSKRDISDRIYVNLNTAKGVRTDLNEAHNLSVDKFCDVEDVGCPTNLVASECHDVLLCKPVETLYSANVMLNNCDKQVLKPNICYGASLDSNITPYLVGLGLRKGTVVESALTKETRLHQGRLDNQDPSKQTGITDWFSVKAEKQKYEESAAMATDQVKILGHTGEASDSNEPLTGCVTSEKIKFPFANKMEGTGPLGLPDQARVVTMATIDYGSEMSEHPLGSSTSSRASISESSVMYDASNKISDFDESSLNDVNTEEDLEEVNEGNWNETLKSFILQNLENGNLSKSRDEDTVSRPLRRPSLEALLEEKIAEHYLHRNIDLLRNKQLDADQSSKDITDKLVNSDSFKHVDEVLSSVAKTTQGDTRGNYDILDLLQKECRSNVSPPSNSSVKLTADHYYSYEKEKDKNISAGSQACVPSTVVPIVLTNPSLLPVKTYSNQYRPSIYFHNQSQPVPAHGGVFDKGQHSNGLRNKGGNNVSDLDTVTVSDDSEHDFLLNLVKGESNF